ncbi:AAA domain-containing protein [Algoriphagus boseongensis]|uniref:DNA 3'-5' helicase II n=1 Tax=Algoriphagus boseongensis TaxID=1442587 RepID=A0A4R6T2F2_9BACT|nr:3'-5' exonuclease [Algoriphagus boseongensis]TDQ15192.1 AAA domain-containing protein [Algoriphagus boseongensis]
MSKESWYINESELDDYQVPIIQKKMSASFIVKGCAGSGKTVLALWKAKEIADAKLGSYYVIVYTKALRQFINDGVREIGIDGNHVLHHHSWKGKGKPSADFIIVDEVQDFTKEELTELQSAAKKAFILFGDSAQQLYKGLKSGLMTMEQIAYHTSLSMEQLVLNHRLPKKIARVAEYLNEGGDSLVSRCKKEGANKPFLVKAKSWEAQLDFIRNAIEERGYVDVAILFPENHAVKKADKYYSSKGYLVEAKYDISWPDDTKFNLNFYSENPKLLTYHSAKGLQFEAVFIPDCSMDSLPGGSANSLYVAITRSYQDLFLIHSNGLTDYLDDVPLNIFEKIDLPG